MRVTSHKWTMCFYYQLVLVNIDSTSTQLHGAEAESDLAKCGNFVNFILCHLLGVFPSSPPVVIAFIYSVGRQTTLMFKFSLYLESLCVWYLKKKHVCFIIMYLYPFFLSFCIGWLRTISIAISIWPCQYQDVISKHRNIIRIYKTQYRLCNMIF